MSRVLSVLILSVFLFSSATYANQKNTVLEETLSVGTVELKIPAVDGLNDLLTQKKVNALLAEEIKKLSQQAQNRAVTYKVIMNRPSLLSVLLQSQGEVTIYKAVNIDLTTGQKMELNNFFTGLEEAKYANILIGEEGIFCSPKDGAAYDNYVPYVDIMENIRIGEAGRLLAVERLTEQSAGKKLKLSKAGLLAIKLPSNAGTGYQWVVKSGSPDFITIGNSFTIPHTNGPVTGAAGTEIIFMGAKKAGLYNVTMEYKRSWERSAVESFSFIVEVG